MVHVSLPRTLGVLLAMSWLGTLFGCGGGITPPAPEATAVARLAGSVEVAWYDTAGKKPQGPNAAGLTDGRLVRIRLNALADASALASLPDLRRLSLDSAALAGPLPCASLQHLTLQNTAVDLTWLAGCTSLESLEIERGGLTTLHGFPALPGLRRLHLGRDPITSLAGLPELPELTQLTVVGSKLDSLASLRPQPKLANIVAPGLVEKPATETAATEAPSPFGRNEVLGIDIPPPPNPWVDAVTESKGSTSGLTTQCTVVPLGNFKLTCDFGIKRLSGMVPLEVRIGSTHKQPGVLAKLSVQSGTVRLYMPYFGKYQYVEATPGNPVEVRGILGKAWRSAGKLGMYQVVVQAMDGDAEGVAVNLVNAIK
jgi:hypothetical protein